MNHLGRNDPCPCGSGRKYKKCCLRQATLDPLIDFKEAAGGRVFESVEDLQVFADQFIGLRNQSPCDDFLGLSADQMDQLLYRPFASPNIIQFPCEAAVEEVPLLNWLTQLVEGLGEAGLPHTAKGNLPLKLCRQVARTVLGEEWYQDTLRYGPIRSELDLPDLLLTRTLAQWLGLIRKYRKRFVVTRRYHELMQQEGLSGLCRSLLEIYTQRLDWRMDPNLFIVQQSFAFSLWALDRYGDRWRPTSFYEDIFLNAYPHVLSLLEMCEEDEAEKCVRQAYRQHVLVNFGAEFGLVELGDGESFMGRMEAVRVSQRFGQMVRFEVQGLGA